MIVPEEIHPKENKSKKRTLIDTNIVNNDRGGLSDLIDPPQACAMVNMQAEDQNQPT